MKLFLAAMIRNEIDVLPSWLAHIGALFDSGCLVDHLCGDGSEQLLRRFAQRPGWACRRVDSAAYLQAELSNELVARAFLDGADAVFLLDADEFVAGLDRAGLERAVSGLSTTRRLGQLRWRNCVPGEYREAFAIDRPAWLCDPSEHKKIVLPRWVHERWPGLVRVNQGNHTAFLPEPVEEAPLAELYHFPVRSQRQLARKILTTYLAQASRPDGVVAPHIRALYETLVSRELTPPLLNAIAADYGAPFALVTGVDAVGMAARGFRLEVPRVTVEGR